MNNHKKVRLASGPFVSQAMHKDILKRVARNKKSSIGIELEKDWEAARKARRKK